MKRKKCVRRYMARKVWGGLGSFLKAALCISMLFVVLMGVSYLELYQPTIWAVLCWTVLSLVGLIIIYIVAMCIIDLYREARKECGYDQD